MNVVCSELFRRQETNFPRLFYLTSLCCHFGIFRAAKRILAGFLKFSWHGFGKTAAARKKRKQVKMEGFCHNKLPVASKLQVIIIKTILKESNVEQLFLFCFAYI